MDYKGFKGRDCSKTVVPTFLCDFCMLRECHFLLGICVDSQRLSLLCFLVELYGFNPYSDVFL